MNLKALLRGPWLIPLLLLFYATSVRDGHNWQGDFSQYVLHAQNLLEGHPYTDLDIVSADNLMLKGTPPGYPFALMPVLGVFGLNFYALKIQIVLFLGLALWAYWALVKTQLPRSWAVGVLAFMALAPWLLKFSNSLLSDIPFLAVALLAILVGHQFFQHSPTISRTALTALCLLLTCLFRSIGIVLIGTLVLYAIAFRRSHIVPIFLAGLSAYGMSHWINIGLGSGGGHVSVLSSQMSLDPSVVLATVLKNVISIKRPFLQYMAVYPSRNEAGLLYGICNWATLASYLLFAGLGAYRSIKKRNFYAQDFFVPIYFAVLIIYPYRSPTRYLIPIFPFLTLYAFVGFRLALAGAWQHTTTFRSWVRRHRQIASLKAFLPTAVYLPVFLVFWAYYTFLPTSSGANILLDPDVQGLFKNVRTAQVSGVFFWRPRILHLFTGVPTISIYNMNAFAWDLDWMLDFSDQHQVSHLILDPHNAKFTEFVRAHPHRFQSVYRNNQYELFRIQKNPEPVVSTNQHMPDTYK